jgi:hypothetical protein
LAVIDDRWAYRLAVGFVGLALVAFVIGATIVAAAGKTVPQQLWDTGSALAGALLGIIQPQPSKPQPRAQAEGHIRKALRPIGQLIREAWANRSVVILLAIFGLSLAFGIRDNLPELQALAAAAGGVLIGVLVPSPSR